MNSIKATLLSQWKRVLIFSICLILMAGATWFWFYSQRYVSTEDAYLNANVVKIAPQVTGQVLQLYVSNNQFVEKGQPLFDLDPVSFKVALDKAEAQFAIDQANLQNIQATSERSMRLVKKNILSRQTGDDMIAKLKSANATLKLSQANLTDAKLKLKYTHVVAPASGWITNMSLREGNIAEANQPVFAIISNSEFWIDANFKETELEFIKHNQHASIRIDMYPKKHFSGVVESISGGSGSAFSLMPPQNATGNWVKVTQRVPVRVRIQDINLNNPLRIGTSAKVTIDLKSQDANKPS